MPAAPAIDVSTLINERPIGRLQWRVVLFGFLIVALDGFDTAIMGFIAPELSRVWGIAPSSLGPVLCPALAGLALGALLAGPLADRVGRKTVLVASVFLFGLWTLVAAWSPDLTTLLVLRATGSSWMHGIGRWGAISSAFAGAQMLGAGWSFAQVFSALAIPALIAAAAVFAKGGWTRGADGTQPAAPGQRAPGGAAVQGARA
uniref:MFS transporter n=1 Tax=Cupriavidus ulmosensis TaxID=3065913 RepID=UPI00296ADA7B|nr:MFS transporter [Cupriavidus sp. CV2]